MIIALITKRNNPRVMIVIGRVKMTRTGLIKKLSKPNTKAKTSAVVYRSICTPGVIHAAINAASEVTNMRKRMFIQCIYCEGKFFSRERQQQI